MLSKKRKVVTMVAVLVVLGLLCLGVYFLFFHMRTTAHIVSVSPDGMYKCEVTERANGSQSVGKVLLYQRVPPVGDVEWAAHGSVNIHNDSAGRSNYSIDWAYNDKRRSTKVVVFGDSGGAPFDGTIIYERNLDPNAKLRGEK